MTLQSAPIIVVTTGEPAGIGPEVSTAAALFLRDRLDARIVLMGDLRMLGERAQHAGYRTQWVEFDAHHLPAADTLEVIDVPLNVACQAGRLDPANATAVLAMLDAAISGALDGRFAAIVTAPVQKSTINQAGIPFTGHTEYLALRTDTARVVMMLTGAGLRVALATTHLPLAEVSGAINQEGLVETLGILAADLKRRFGIARARVLVCGLNPHAGEGGFLGGEERATIEPAIRTACAQGLDVVGPLPADTLFQPKYLERCDAVLAMYHDQGLPVLKFASFGHGVNVTLGLPIIRTSVDHGTALEWAGSAQADSGSMVAAIQTAHAMMKASLPQ